MGQSKAGPNDSQSKRDLLFLRLKLEYSYSFGKVKNHAQLHLFWLSMSNCHIGQVAAAGGVWIRSLLSLLKKQLAILLHSTMPASWVKLADDVANFSDYIVGQ